MIRELIEPDMNKISDLAPFDKETNQAWVRIQIRLYRYNAILEDIERGANGGKLTWLGIERELTNYIAQEKTDLAINRKNT